jgi:hypothetical protein
MIDGKFQFSAVPETLARDKIAVYIDVWDSHAALAFSRYENGVIITKYVEGEDLYAWALRYEDLVEAVEAHGAINISGWYPANEKIIDAVRGRDVQAIALFASQIKAQQTYRTF